MTGILVLTLLAGLVGIGLSLAAQRLPNRPNDLVEQLNSLLPQQQCAQCGFPGCRPYAQAMATGKADINQCPPGGEQCIIEIAQLLERSAPPLNEHFGLYKPPQLARINESACIGCTLCIDACPVDAILGAPRAMHTVIEAACTGCELCIAPCPVDCISLHPKQ